MCKFLSRLPYGSMVTSFVSATRGHPLSQGVPSSKTVHWTVFEFTPGTSDSHAKDFALCGARPGALGLTCRFGRYCCYAAVSTGHPHPMDPAAFEKAGETLSIC